MRELLPHVFTLTSKRRLFSVALAVILADPFLLGSMVLCAVPTFLAPACPARDSPSHRGGKGRDFFRSKKEEVRRKNSIFAEPILF